MKIIYLGFVELWKYIAKGVMENHYIQNIKKCYVIIDTN
jgi:hypothetical protein